MDKRENSEISKKPERNDYQENSDNIFDTVSNSITAEKEDIYCSKRKFIRKISIIATIVIIVIITSIFTVIPSSSNNKTSTTQLGVVTETPTQQMIVNSGTQPPSVPNVLNAIESLNIENVKSVTIHYKYNPGFLKSNSTLDLADINQKNSIIKLINLIHTTTKFQEDNYYERNYLDNATHFRPSSIIILTNDGEVFSIEASMKGTSENGSSFSFKLVDNQLVIYNKDIRDHETIGIISSDLYNLVNEIIG